MELRRRGPQVSSETQQRSPSPTKPSSSSSWKNTLWLIGLVFFYSFWFLFGLLVLRKTSNAITAVRYVKQNSHTVSVESIENSAEFEDLIEMLDRDFTRPPAFLLLNQYALNMTYNFLCNTGTLEGAHDRFVFVTLDTVARDQLRLKYPNIRQFHWPTPSLYKPFSFAEGPYQTIYLLRANLAVSLLRRGKSFWMMQQDTFWRRNLFDLKMEDNMSYDAIFDQLGIDKGSHRAEWVNGANFFIRANNDTLQFWERLSDKLAHWYTPDMGIMIHQCHTWGKPRCAYIPHEIGHSWEWMYTEQKDPPYIMQLDCETDGGSKLMQLGRFGFHFTDNNGTCFPEKVELARRKMEEGRVDVSYTSTRLFPSWGRLQFKAYWWIVDYMLWTPIIGPLLKPYLPLVGYILMITIISVNGHHISRQYTPTAATRTTFQVPIKIYGTGKFTKHVGSWSIGSTVEWIGPYVPGHADWLKGASSLQCFAAGTGIAPFVRIIGSLLDDDDCELRIQLVFCVRRGEDVLFKNLLDQWSKHWNFTLIVVTTSPEVTSNAVPHLATLHTGCRLKEDLFASLLTGFSSAENDGLRVAVCGSKSFEKDVINFAKRSCLPDSQVFRFPG